MKRLQRVLLGVSVVIGLASAASAANVAVFGLSTSQVPAPHTATAVSLVDIEGGALAGYDVFLIGRASSWSATACTAVSTFIAGGGGVVTEWNGITFLFSAIGPNEYGSMPPPQCGYFAGTVDYGSSFGTDIPIDVLNPASPSMVGLSDPFSMGGGSEFFWTVSGYDPALWTVDAQYTGHGGTWPAVLWSDALGGVVVVGAMDYQDVLPGNATAAQLLGNMIQFADTGAGQENAIPALGGTGIALLIGLLALAGTAVLRAVRS
jgi:hypothetical protein